MKQTILFIIIVIIHAEIKAVKVHSIHGVPIFEDQPCNGTTSITTLVEGTLNEGYNVIIDKELCAKTILRIKFDSEASITLSKKKSARVIKLLDNSIKIVLNDDLNKTELIVKGPITHFPPYITSFKIGNVEYCKKPNTDYFEKRPIGAKPRPDVPDRFCGRRKVNRKELIVNGRESLPGAYPWHVAINSIHKGTLKYICGGTIISKYFILTAAHCAAIHGVPVLPESLGVSLGKHNLIGGDVSPREKDVYEVIIHEKFNHISLANDIALLKLRTAIRYNDYIQPACLWNDDFKKLLPEGQAFGTVSGWGFDQTDSLSIYLQESVMPIIDDITCIRRKPEFYAKLLDGTRFCAGFLNGTSACNGDSGGGLIVYIPYITPSESQPFSDGAWYVRGLVSLSLSKADLKICDPNEYGIFTDVAAYKDWIQDHMD